MKKRLQIFGGVLGFGGIEREVVILANSLVDLYDIELVFLSKEENTKIHIDRKVVLRLLNINEINLFNSIKVKKAIDEFKPDVIINTEGMYNKYIVKHASCKKIYWEHNHHDNNKLDIDLINKNVLGYDGVVVPNKGLLNLYNCSNKYLIPNMIDGLPNVTASLNSNRIIFVGKLEERKNVSELIRVFDKVVKKNNDVTLEIIGNGSKRREIESLINKLGLGSKVDLLGDLNSWEVGKELEESRIFVTTSISESFGKSLVEAMSYSLPVVCFKRVSVFNDIITHEINGILCEDEDDMEEYIIKLLENKKYAEEIGSCGRERSCVYDVKNLKGDWIKIL